MQEALNDVAGTGAARQQSFVAQVRTYMDQWQEFFVPKVMKKVSLTAADYDRIPRFQFQEESESAITGRVGTSLILLFVPVLLFSAVAMWRLKQFPVVGQATKDASA
jgi:ABC-2 type transport system permease protein